MTASLSADKEIPRLLGNSNIV